MANTKSSKKHLIKSKIKRSYNSRNKSMLRTFIKKVHTAINKKDKDTAMKLFSTLQKTIDQQATKGLIHKNKASRYKSNIHKKIQSITT